MNEILRHTEAGWVLCIAEQEHIIARSNASKETALERSLEVVHRLMLKMGEFVNENKDFTGRRIVDAKEFARAWNQSDSGTEAALKLGMSFYAATTKASQLRKKGVELKKFSGRRKKLDTQRFRDEVNE